MPKHLVPADYKSVLIAKRMLRNEPFVLSPESVSKPSVPEKPKVTVPVVSPPVVKPVEAPKKVEVAPERVRVMDFVNAYMKH